MDSVKNVAIIIAKITVTVSLFLSADVRELITHCLYVGVR